MFPLLLKTPIRQFFAVNSFSNDITLQEFSMVDLRVAKVVQAKNVESSKWLLEMNLDLGPNPDYSPDNFSNPRIQKRVFSGIKGKYSPEDMLNSLVVCVANLEPRKMSFGISEAMILASGTKESPKVVRPPPNAIPGERVS